MITRKQHLDTIPLDGTDADRMAHHRAYYAQLVTPATIAFVVRRIGADALRASKCVHFNDIPLMHWDRTANCMPCGSFAPLEDYPSLGNAVCVAKEAARQWLESQGVPLPESKEI